MKCYTHFGLKTLNYDKVVDLLVTERLKNSKLHEKLQKLETGNENLKSANRPKSQVKAATHAHVEQSKEDEPTKPMSVTKPRPCPAVQETSISCQLKESQETNYLLKAEINRRKQQSKVRLLQEVNEKLEKEIKELNTKLQRETGGGNTTRSAVTSNTIANGCTKALQPTNKLSIIVASDSMLSNIEDSFDLNTTS